VGGLSLEERKVRSMERVAAAQEAAPEQAQLPERHSKIMGNPRANHPNYLTRCFLLIACGRYRKGGSAKDAGARATWRCCGQLPRARMCFTGPGRRSPSRSRCATSWQPRGATWMRCQQARAADPKSSAEAYWWGESLATFLTVFVSPVLGGKMRAFNEECHRLSCQEQGYTPTAYVGCLEAALLQVDSNVTRTIARAKDRAADSGRRLVAGLSPLPVWTDLCMARPGRSDRLGRPGERAGRG